MKKNNHLSLVSLIITVLLISCSKERKWEIEITSIDDITYNEADFEAVVDLGKSFNRTGGMYLSTNPEPTEENSEFTEWNLPNSDVINSSFEDLYANTTYYAQCFINGDEMVHYSEVKSFTTADLPPLDCSVNAGEIYYSGTGENESCESMIRATSETSSPFRFEVETAVGDLNFSFPQMPEPGIYTTLSSASDLSFWYNQPFSVFIEGFYSHGGSGATYRSVGNQNIQVKKDGSGNVSIAFCELAMKRVGTGIAPVDLYLTGMVSE